MSHSSLLLCRKCSCFAQRGVRYILEQFLVFLLLPRDESLYNKPMRVREGELAPGTSDVLIQDKFHCPTLNIHSRAILSIVNLLLRKSQLRMCEHEGCFGNICSGTLKSACKQVAYVIQMVYRRIWNYVKRNGLTAGRVCKNTAIYYELNIRLPKANFLTTTLVESHWICDLKIHRDTGHIVVLSVIKAGNWFRSQSCHNLYSFSTCIRNCGTT